MTQETINQILKFRDDRDWKQFHNPKDLAISISLEAASINEDNYFNNLLGNDIVKIAKDLREAHGKDTDTGDQITPVEDMLGTFDELRKADNATQAQMVMYSKLFKINFTKMDPYEFKTFTDILQRYSDLCKPVKGNGRGKKKK